MTKTIQTKVCVGGCYDGQRYDAQGSRFAVPIRQPLPPLGDGQQDVSGAQELPALNAEYQEMVWRSPQGSVSFWIEKGISELTAMEKLLNHYIKR